MFWKINLLIIAVVLCNSRVYASEYFPAQENKIDTIKTVTQYLTAINAADESTFEQQFEYEFLLLVNSQQRKYYMSLPSLTKRKGYIKYFWRANNPNPLLSENDVLQEHIRRRNYVRENFSKKEPPFFDDRGKYYIKYGRPAVRFQDSGGVKQLVVVDFRDDPNADYVVKSNESWAYENVARDFVVHFVKIGQAFMEVESLTDIIISPRRRTKQAVQWCDIVKKRASISPVLARVASDIERIETALRTGISSPTTATEVTMPTQRIFKMEAENKREIIKAIRKAPPTAHDPINALNRLSFEDRISQFGEPNGSTRVEITLYAPFKKNFDNKDAYAIDNYQLKIEFGGLLRNADFIPVAEDYVKTKYPFRLIASEKLPFAIGTLTFYGPPQQYELTTQVKDERINKIGFSRQILDIRDFGGDKLMISDLQFFTEFNKQYPRELLPTREKQNLEIAPYPFLKVKKSTSLLCYFEIYHLLSAGIKSEYKITYKLVTSHVKDNVVNKISNLIERSKDVAVSFSFTQPVTAENSSELISIDLSNVENGNYQLQITVADMNEKNISTSTFREIVITE